LREEFQGLAVKEKLTVGAEDPVTVISWVRVP
jgi:hypothetical protein